MTPKGTSDPSLMTPDEIRAWAASEGFDEDLSAMAPGALRSWAVVRYRQRYLGWPKPRPNPVKQAVDADWPTGPWLLRTEPGAPGRLYAKGVPDRHITVIGLRRVVDHDALALLVREGDTVVALQRRNPHDTWGEDASATQVLVVGLDSVVAVTSWPVPTHVGAVPDPVPPPAGPTSDLFLDLERKKAFT